MSVLRRITHFKYSHSFLAFLVTLAHLTITILLFTLLLGVLISLVKIDKSVDRCNFYNLINTDILRINLTWECKSYLVFMTLIIHNCFIIHLVFLTGRFEKNRGMIITLNMRGLCSS